MTNTKLRGVALHEVPEIEQLRSCENFGRGTCPSCYAEPLLRLRKRSSRHVHKAASRTGLLRLGTYIEVQAAQWAEFKAGTGRWDCCGASWVREDFPKRYYFLVTRGLLDRAFYRRVLEDPYCVNLQVSVDALPKPTPESSLVEPLGGFFVIPRLDRLAWFQSDPKVIFRFKTTPRNVAAFSALGIPTHRIMETPLRDGGVVYGKATPLEAAGWPLPSFGRCNTRCEDCHLENGMLLCAARPGSLARVLAAPRPPPPRHTFEKVPIKWKEEALRCLREHGGSCTVQEAYAWFGREFPVLRVGKDPRFRIRVALQDVGVQTGERGRWHLPAQPTLASFAAKEEAL